MTGGGDLSADRTLALATLSPSPAGTYPTPSEVVVDARGRITGITAGGGGGGDALTDLGLNYRFDLSGEIPPGKYLIRGGASNILKVTSGSPGSYWKFVFVDTNVTAGELYPADDCQFRVGGGNASLLSIETGSGYCYIELWKFDATRYHVAALKAGTGAQT